MKSIPAVSRLFTLLAAVCGIAILAPVVAQTAQTGATLAELMGRLGHSTPGAALRYQHAAQARDVEIARRLSALVAE